MTLFNKYIASDVIILFGFVDFRHVRNEKEIIAFGNKLRKLRTEAKLSQEKFAWEADIGIATIQRMEKGEQAATIDMLIVLAKTLKIHPSRFFEDTIFDFNSEKK